MANKPLSHRISENYDILNVLGQGCYGYVYKCFKRDTKETVAVKVLKRRHSHYSNKREVLILDKLRCLDPDTTNIIRCLEWFHSLDQTFMVFEKLDVSLFDYMSQRKWVPAPLNGLRTIVRDVATALKVLKGLGLIHADLKLDNILLVHHQTQPFRVKVIDFGLALETFEAWPLRNVQALWYRSPETILGLSFTEVIDMWSLGSIMAEMLLGFPLFPGRHEYDTLRFIVDLLGEPPRRLLNGGLNSPLFCHGRCKYRMLRRWRVMTPMEFHAGTGIKPREDRRYQCSSLEDLKTLSSHQRNSADRNACFELLKEMLQVDPKTRITPNNVLAHPFITRSDLETGGSRPVSKSFGSGETLAREASGSRAASDKDTAETHVDDRCPSQVPVGVIMAPPAEKTTQREEATQQSSSMSLALESVTKTSWSVDSGPVRDPSAAPNSCVEDPGSVLNQEASSGINSLHTIDVSDPGRKKKKKAIPGFFSTLKRSSCFCVFEDSDQGSGLTY